MFTVAMVMASATAPTGTVTPAPKDDGNFHFIIDAPVSLGVVLLCLLLRLVNVASPNSPCRQWFIHAWYGCADPKTYISPLLSAFAHDHKDWGHCIGNLSWLVLIMPMVGFLSLTGQDRLPNSRVFLLPTTTTTTPGWWWWWWGGGGGRLRGWGTCPGWF